MPRQRFRAPSPLVQRAVWGGLCPLGSGGALRTAQGCPHWRATRPAAAGPELEGDSTAGPPSRNSPRFRVSGFATTHFPSAGSKVVKPPSGSMPLNKAMFSRLLRVKSSV